jgi:6,7-dimethyl-8-ribityllumazine synthase
MIKSLSIVRRVARKEGFRAVAGFLGAIGFEQLPGDGGESSASFVAPIGKLWLNSLSDQRSPELVEVMKHYHDGMILLEVSDPETVWLIARKRGYKIVWDHVSKKTGEHTFAVKLPGEFLIAVRGAPEQPFAAEGDLRGIGKRFAVVVSRFNSFITERLLQGALDGLRRSGVSKNNIQVVRVPGAFEIPLAARTLAETKKYDAILCIGCLLRGDTAHYDVIVNEVTRGIGQSAQETGIPHALGVLTCETLEQAIDRAGLKMGNKGLEAALAAVEMANLKTAISRLPPAVSKTGGRPPASGGRTGKPTPGFRKRKPRS